jgi:site-specific recombinase XerD
LFVSKKGNRLTIRTMEDNFKKILIKSELETHFNVTCHTLRHSFASHLNDKDVDILVI